MPALISKQNAAAIQARKFKENANPSITSSMKKLKSVAAVVQLGKQKNEEGAHDKKSKLDITSKKNHVESWLKSQLGVQGSCTQFLEAHLAEKCQSRSVAEKKFRWDISHFVVYSLFLVLYSFSACGTNMRAKLLARNMLEAEIGNFDSVQHIGN
jgi:hypothetical protein